MNSMQYHFSANSDPRTGTVELIEFNDFLSPRNPEARTLLSSILEQFNGQVTYKYRHYPNLESDQSLLAALAIEAAKRQGHFWPMYNALLTQSPINCSTLSALARTMGLDQLRFLNDLLDDRIHDIVKADWQAGYQSGVRNAPTLFVGGHQFHGKLTRSRLLPVIRFHLNRCDHPVLSTVDQVNGIVYWNAAEFG